MFRINFGLVKKGLYGFYSDGISFYVTCLTAKASPILGPYRSNGSGETAQVGTKRLRGWKKKQRKTKEKMAGSWMG